MECYFPCGTTNLYGQEKKNKQKPRKAKQKTSKSYKRADPNSVPSFDQSVECALQLCRRILSKEVDPSETQEVQNVYQAKYQA